LAKGAPQAEQRQREQQLRKIYAWIAIHRFVNTCAQRLEALRGPMHAGMPTFIIETAQQRRQFSAEIDGLVARHRIAKSVERADQNGMGLVAIPFKRSARSSIQPSVSAMAKAEFLYLWHLMARSPA